MKILTIASIHVFQNLRHGFLSAAVSGKPTFMIRHGHGILECLTRLMQQLCT